MLGARLNHPDHAHLAVAGLAIQISIRRPA
jgi:hypothetical protein